LSEELYSRRYSGWTWSSKECKVIEDIMQHMSDDEISYVSKSIAKEIRLELLKKGVR